MRQDNLNDHFETDFKIAQILEKQKKSDQALSRYNKILHSFREMIQENPNFKDEFSFPLLSLGRIIDILKIKGDVDQALKLIDYQKNLINYFKEINSNSSYDNSNEIINKMLDDIDLILKSSPAKTVRNVLDNYIKEQEQQKNKIDKENMLQLLHIVEAKKNKIANSKTRQIIEWINENPFPVLIFGFIFLGIFMMIVFSKFSTDSQKERYEKRLEAKKKISHQIKDDPLNAEIKNKNKNGHKMTEKEFRQFQEKMQEIQKNVRDSFGPLNSLQKELNQKSKPDIETKQKIEDL